MFATNKITFEYLQAEIAAVIQSPTSFNQKVHELTSRMLNESSLGDIARLEHIAQSYKERELSLSANIVSDIINEVKCLKPDMNKLQKVEMFMRAGHLDEAVSLLGKVKNPLCTSAARDLYDEIATKYRQQGEYNKAAQIEANFTDEINATESPSERAVFEMGKKTVHSGLEALRSTIPGTRATLPSDNQMDKALDGLHNMSLTSTGRKKDSSLEEDSIVNLQEKLAAAEKKLDLERGNFERALLTHNQNIIMPALMQKQAAMQEVLFLKRALDSKGVSQSEDVNPAELFDKTIKQGLSNLMGALQQRGMPSDEKPDDCKVS